MGIKTKILEHNVVELDVTIDKNEVSKEYNKACSRISQNINIPGFRKGKAPKSIVEKHVGLHHIQTEVLDTLLPKIFADIIKKENYDVITEPVIESYEFEEGKDVKVIAKFELRPEVKLGQYKEIEYKVKEFKQEKDALDKELEALASKLSTLEIVKDRATQKTDVIFFDFEGKVDGELIQGGSAKNYMLDLGNSNFIPGFAEQLIDKKIGEEFEIDVKFPEQYHDEKLKGKDAKFAIKINEIKERIIPEINDDMAKKIGKFNNLEELKADIQKAINETEKNENEKNSMNEIFDIVIKNAKVEIQPNLIQREKDILTREMKQRVEAQGIDYEKFIESEDKEKIDKELTQEAENRVKNSLVVSEIAKQEKLTVLPQDLTIKISELAKAYGMTLDSIYKEVQKNPQMLNMFTQQILSQKVADLLIKENKVEFTK